MFVMIISLLSISMTLVVHCKFTGEPTIEIMELATKAGYQIEKHELLTEDGYVLDVFRLPPRCLRAKSCNTSRSIKPVLLMHGLLATGETYLTSGNDSLGFFLNDKGYDVWLGNARGTWHSRRHKTLDPDTDKEFWKFTWHEISIYDVSAMIDYILNVTKSSKMSYIGHSQGSANFYVLCSERPEYNKKLNIHISLAAGTFIGHTKHPIFRLFVPFLDILKVIPDYLGFYELEAIFRIPLLNAIAKTLCVNYNKVLLGICKFIMDYVVDGNGNDVDTHLLPQIFEVLPGGISIYQFIHYLQNVVNGGFRPYDWGKELNMKKYNSESIRTYNISKVTVPVALYYGQNDFIIAPKDIKILASLLPNLVDFVKVSNAKWSHMDFLWGRDAVSLVYERLVRTLDKYVHEDESLLN